MNPGRHRAGFLSLVTILATLAPGAWAKPVIEQDVPLQRLVANLSRELEKAPKDAGLHYALGRSYAIAFYQGTDTLRLAQGNPTLSVNALPYGAARAERGYLTPKRLRYLRASLRHYHQAIALGHGSQAELGLAWLYEYGCLAAARLGGPPGVDSRSPPREAARYSELHERLRTDERVAAEAELAEEVDRAFSLVFAERHSKDPKVRAAVEEILARCWVNRALEIYRRLYREHIGADLREGTLSSFGGPLSVEVGSSIVRIISARPPTEAGRAEIAKIEADRVLIAKRGVRHLVSPLIFSLSPATDVTALLDPEAATDFDLAGDGGARRWPWVAPETGILVWDPDGAGAIRSGRQLFGQVTWWMPWRDGYQPLAALDDDGDGWLSGRELDGIAVWRDRDQNGRSAPHEVISAGSFGIARLATFPTAETAAGLRHDAGLVMSDGHRVPTYDWLPTSLPAVPAQR
jgi:hypothetical protein